MSEYVRSIQLWPVVTKDSIITNMEKWEKINEDQRYEREPLTINRHMTTNFKMKLHQYQVLPRGQENKYKCCRGPSCRCPQMQAQNAVQLNYLLSTGNQWFDSTINWENTPVVNHTGHKPSSIIYQPPPSYYTINCHPSPAVTQGFSYDSLCSCFIPHASPSHWQSENHSPPLSNHHMYHQHVIIMNHHFATKPSSTHHNEPWLTIIMFIIRCIHPY